MKITDNALKLLHNELKENNCNTFIVKISTSCCSEGYNIHIGFSNENLNEVKNIDGMGFIYDGPSELLNEIIIDSKGQMFIFD